MSNDTTTKQLQRIPKDKSNELERIAIENEKKGTALHPSASSTQAQIIQFPETRENQVELIRAQDVPVMPISWLWPGYLALGKVHILCGSPGVGKSTLALKFAASTSTGVGWPDESLTSHGNVVIWSGEDDPADTLVPRLILSGARTDRVFIVGNTMDIESGGKRPFRPDIDIPFLQKRIRETGNVKLLIVDPLVSAVLGDSHKNADVRQSLQTLVDLAAEEGVAVLGISHFSKSTRGREPLERVTGSLAFGALARIVMVCSKQADTDARIFCRAKSNIGADDGGFEYSILQAALPDNPAVANSFAQWGKPVDGTARDILATAELNRTGFGGDKIN